MKRVPQFFLVVVAICFSRLITADIPKLADANKLFDFAEIAEPTLFFPPVQTQQTNEAGVDWFYRYFLGSDSYAAVNINGTETYFAGNVYVLGGAFGNDLLFIDTLENLLTLIDNSQPPPPEAENAITNPGNGNCVARKFPPQNDTAHFQTITFSGSAPVVTNNTETYEEVTDTKTITIIEQASISSRKTSFFESRNGMFFNSETDTETITTNPGLPPSQQNLNITYEPSLFLGPSELLCEEQEWFVATVTQTLISDPDASGNGPLVNQTLPTVGTVDSTNDVIVVPAGTFTTIKMTLSFPGSTTIFWIDVNTGLRVMTESYEGDSENPSSVEKLTLLELPF